MGINAYFFDTYALYESIKDNPSYSQLKNVLIITTKLNLMELHYALLREKGEETADLYFDIFSGFTSEIKDDIIKEASKFRHTNKTKKFSYVDCIGYCLARTRGVKFLTGDNAFENMPGVEFVK